MQIGNIPRTRLGIFPTPLQELTRLGRELGGPRLFLKRDDLNGVGLGGNKLRKLEYAFAEAQTLGATTVITIGGLQSNHVRLTAAAANRLGMKSVLILRGARPQTLTGNLLVDEILGPSEIHYVDTEAHPDKGAWDEVSMQKAERIADRLRSDGEISYIIPNGCKAFHGALGYSGCVLETVSQLRERDLAPNAFIATVGTTSMYTGLLLGAHLYAGGDPDVIGISVVSTPPDTLADRIATSLDDAVKALGLHTRIPREDVIVLGDYVGEGYAIPSESMKEAVVRLARTEGIVMDPVYNGKTVAGVLDLVQKGRFRRDDVVVIVHSGGVPGLFAEAQVPTFQVPA